MPTGKTKTCCPKRLQLRHLFDDLQAMVNCVQRYACGDCCLYCLSWTKEGDTWHGVASSDSPPSLRAALRDEGIWRAYSPRSHCRRAVETTQRMHHTYQGSMGRLTALHHTYLLHIMGRVFRSELPSLLIDP